MNKQLDVCNLFSSSSTLKTHLKVKVTESASTDERVHLSKKKCLEILSTPQQSFRFFSEGRDENRFINTPPESVSIDNIFCVVNCSCN